MVLDPLTNVGVRMFVTIRIGRRQFVVHVLRNGEGSEDQQEQSEAETDASLHGP